MKITHVVHARTQKGPYSSIDDIGTLNITLDDVNINEIKFIEKSLYKAIHTILTDRENIKLEYDAKK